MRKYMAVFISITFLSIFYSNDSTNAPFSARETETIDKEAIDKEVSYYVDTTPRPITPITESDGLLHPDDSPLSLDIQLYTILKYRSLRVTIVCLPCKDKNKGCQI